MTFPNKSEVAAIKARYPIGTRLVLESDMQDPYAPIAAGTRGTVDYVDDCGHIGMRWDNNRSLNLIIGEDNFRKLKRSELIKEEARAITKLENCPNMFSINEVFELAVANDFNFLADFAFMHTKEWGAFILTGELPPEIDTEESL
jgi:hypothetical protein